ncbi:hypothetical protein BKA58DRAFT_400841 [Alternaria rosae]|uniref:uncharacterized protein n=1 Tax=Alternaria rosae TaxID=1187941 RepID=UPI001E8DB9E2|nr:uncharacterized protein BKA58DRAFT_400841 [Alternaria rosae]KAH6872627.1 hypothetical protein BKA58DRAFT_400841 [Alternaria rosae]
MEPPKVCFGRSAIALWKKQANTSGTPQRTKGANPCGGMQFLSFLSSAGHNWAGPTRHVVRAPTTAPSWKRQDGTQGRQPPHSMSNTSLSRAATHSGRRGGAESPAPPVALSFESREKEFHTARIHDSQICNTRAHMSAQKMSKQCAEALGWALSCFSSKTWYLRQLNAAGNKQQASRTFTAIVSERSPRGTERSIWAQQTQSWVHHRYRQVGASAAQSNVLGVSMMPLRGQQQKTDT